MNVEELKYVLRTYYYGVKNYVSFKLTSIDTLIKDVFGETTEDYRIKIIERKDKVEYISKWK